MAHRMLGGTAGKRLALFAAALLLALGAMLALAAAASAQDPDDGQSAGGGTASSDEDSDDARMANYCRRLASLEQLQSAYFARLPGSNKNDSDKQLAALPRGDRMSPDHFECAQFYQDQKYPALTWDAQENCVQNELYSVRWTGATQTIDGVDFRQIAKTVDYRCTTTQVPSMSDGSALPADLIPPAEPASRITARFRVTSWLQWSGFERADVPTAPAGETSLAE